MHDRLSRRGLLVTVFSTAAAGGATLAICATAKAMPSNVASNSQLRKEDVRYQDQPKGNQRCSGCSHFVQPGACQVVAGSVNPNGWCLLFQAKST